MPAAPTDKMSVLRRELGYNRRAGGKMIIFLIDKVSGVFQNSVKTI